MGRGCGSRPDRAHRRIGRRRAVLARRRFRGRDTGRRILDPARTRRARGRLAAQRGRNGAVPVIDPSVALRLDGKVAVVTGATRGIGRAIAEACVQAGAGVVVVARKPEELEETERALRSLGGQVATFQGSVSDPAVAEESVALAVEKLGSCDIVVNNAAINPVFAPLMEADLGAVAKVFDANIVGPLR